MIKMNYPDNTAELDKLKKEYWELFKAQESEFNTKIKLLKGRSVVRFLKIISYAKIILGDIQYLVYVFYRFESLSKKNKKKIIDAIECLFSYDQPKISHFFEAHDSIFNLRACHYCNLDSVSVFSTLHGYKDGLDFLRHATMSELVDIHGIGAKKASDIMKLPVRKNYVDSPNSPSFVKNLLQTLKNSKERSRNHFTLDHFIPQNKCCLFARSFYNFVPSCYVCNSKLKRIHLFSDNIKELHKYSPTYEKYEEDGEIKFSLRLPPQVIDMFDYDKPDKDKFLENFNIDVEAVDSNNNIVSVLHLRQRYHIHKETAVRLAYLREKYSDATVAEIERILTASGCATTPDKIKNDIFHSPTHDNESLSKLRKDVMKQLGIK